MVHSGGMAEAAPTPPPITVKSEGVVVGVFSAIAVAFHFWDILEFPESYERGQHSLPSILMGLTVWLGQGVWVSMDRRRRGREVGSWRFLVLFLGPLAVWFYIFIEYRSRAILVFLLSLVPYMIVLAFPPLVAALLGLLRFA